MLVLPAQPAPAAGREARCIRRGVERQLPPGYDVDTHFKPRYNPWDQRLCLVPDGDLFEAICDGSALGGHRPASRPSPRRASGWSPAPSSRPTSIVTATGLNMLPLGGMQLAVDGQRRRAPRDHGLQGHDAQRRAEPGRRDRLHQRLVDAEVRPDLRVRLPAAQPHGRARPPRSARRSNRDPSRRRRSRSSTSPPATSARARPASRSRARRRPGGCTRTTRSTSSPCATATSTTAPWCSRTRCPRRGPSAWRPDGRQALVSSSSCSSSCAASSTSLCRHSDAR